MPAAPDLAAFFNADLALVAAVADALIAAGLPAVGQYADAEQPVPRVEVYCPSSAASSEQFAPTPGSPGSYYDAARRGSIQIQIVTRRANDEGDPVAMAGKVRGVLAPAAQSLPARLPYHEVLTLAEGATTLATDDDQQLDMLTLTYAFLIGLKASAYPVAA